MIIIFTHIKFRGIILLRSDTFLLQQYSHTIKLVRFYKGVDGLKTGYTDTAGYCLTATINKDNMRVIAVVMGEDSSTTRNSEVSGLLDYAYNLYKKDTYITKEEVLGNAKVEKGNVEYANIVTIDDISIINKKEYKRGEIKFELDLKYLKAPIKKGDVVGKIKVIENGNIISEADVTVDKNIEKAGYFTMFIRNLKEIISANVQFAFFVYDIINNKEGEKMATIEDFMKLDIRVGKIVDAKIFEKAKRPAYQLKIDFGSEIGVKKSSAQITEVYKLEDLIGKQILAVVNFPPRQIANFLSEVLVLGTYSKQGIVLIKPDELVENGDKLG